MENDNYGDQDASILENGDVATSEQQEGDEQSSDGLNNDLQAELQKAKELAENYKTRAEKAEKQAKDLKGKNQPDQSKGDMSIKDMFALTKANINEDDIEEITDYAKYKKISIAEALKLSTVKALLAEKEEQRNVASATNVGTSKRGAFKVSDDTLLSKAKKGELPDNDEDIARLIVARRKH